jgi:SAM-dependent methyltransferase
MARQQPVPLASPRTSSHDHGAHDHASHDDGSAAMAELLDLDGAVTHAYLSDVTAWVRRLATRTPRRRILDLGAGTGTGTIALAQRVRGAEMIAVDRSEVLLTRLRIKALDLGLASRVRTVQADLDVAWPSIPPVDVMWASNSLHHMADPDRTLKDMLGAIQPGGLLALAEMEAQPRFLPDDLGLGRPGLESRCQDAAAHQLASAGLHMRPDWAPELTRAGFGPIERRTFSIDLTPPHPPSSQIGTYARMYLDRLRTHVEDRLAADDLATLHRLLGDDGPESLLRRSDLTFRATRTAWIARRP